MSIEEQTIGSSPGSVIQAGTASGGFLTPRRLILGLLVYFSVQVIIRTAMSSSVDLDESQQVVLAQKLQWGYGSNPPLYTWIQSAFFHVFGLSVPSLSLLKNLLLLGTCCLTYLNARQITRSPQAGVAAVLSLFYIASIAWESQRDLTHSVLSATLSAATLFCLIRAHLRKSMRWYFGLGVVAGMGLISKYNYAFWVLGLALAALSLREFRGTILNRKFLSSAGIALLILLPNGIWMLQHRDLALLTSSKFAFAHSLNWWGSVLLGLKNLLTAILAFAGPLALVYFLLYAAKRERTAPGESRETTPCPGWARLLGRAWLIIGFILVLLVLTTRATGFKERWFQPILINLPVFAALLVRARLDIFRLKIMSAATLLIMISVAVIMPGRLMMAERLHREEPLTRPYRNLAHQIADVIPSESTVVCDTTILAGNLRLNVPGINWTSPELQSILGEARTHLYIAWQAHRNPQMPDELRRWLAARSPALPANGTPQYFSATYRFHALKQFKIAVQRIY